MAIIQTVRCPNCGSLAERRQLTLLSQIKTECEACDYLMVTCARTGRVVEAYAPGLHSSKLIVGQAKEGHLLKKLSEIYKEQVLEKQA